MLRGASMHISKILKNLALTSLLFNGIFEAAATTRKKAAKKLLAFFSLSLLREELPKLRFLDDRPVRDNDRAAAIAWLKGGCAEEKKVFKAMQEREQERLQGYVTNLRVLQVRPNYMSIWSSASSLAINGEKSKIALLLPKSAAGL